MATDTAAVDSDHPLLVAYRHDAHKLTGHPHDAAPEIHAGVPVNRTVPLGADADAAALSRSPGEPERTVDNHATRYRLSLLTGESGFDPENRSRAALSRAIDDLLSVSDPEAAHRAWLTSDVAARFNESAYDPYTSCKYHTLLVAALLDNYRAGHEFSDLRLVVDSGGEVVPHRTVYVDDGPQGFTLRIEGAPGATIADASTRLGATPRRAWASTWTQLPVHPLQPDRDRFDRLVDANFRRITSWSTALQYLEDVTDWRPEG
jgi:hypothetical protein